VVPGQKVISTGPYAIVRHPMYSGALVMILGTPLALGSWWGFLLVIPLTLIPWQKSLRLSGVLSKSAESSGAIYLIKWICSKRPYFGPDNAEKIDFLRIDLI
jgi:protein-S-isoprenylcysteine O-methyltransferase Ste14